MYQKASFLILLILYSLTNTYSQQVWSLEKCIQKAIDNSLSSAQANINLEHTKLSAQESKNARLPTLNGSVNADVNFGRTINPVTNDFDNQTRLTNSYGLFGNLLLFNGNRINNTIRQKGFEEDAARADKKNIENELALQVAQAYLNILFAEEQLANAQKRLEQTQSQLHQTDKLIEAGTLPRADRLEILASIARNEQVIVNEQNNLELGFLQLKQLLSLEPDFDLRIEKPTIIIPKSIDPQNFSLRNIYNKAYNYQPIIQAGNIRLKAAQLGIDIAKSLRIPSISLTANVNTFWSNKTLDFNKIEHLSQSWERADDLRLTGQQVGGIEQLFTNVTFGKRAYFDQIQDNFGQGIGLDIRIPIYNANRTNIALQRAKLNILQQGIANQQNEQQLKADIQRSIAAAKAAKKQYEAAHKTVKALREAYANTEKRFELGAINTFEYNTSKNTLDQAEVELIIAKYNYLYTLKVIDFYEGKKITLR